MTTSLLEKTEEVQKHEEKLLEEKVRPDLNLEKWSIWQPAKSKSQPKERVIRREIELPNGDRVLAEVEVGFTNKGVLTTEDQKTLYALLKIWEDKGKGTDPVFYSLRKLAKILKKRWGTNVIEATSKSLLRLRITPLIGLDPTPVSPAAIWPQYIPEVENNRCKISNGSCKALINRYFHINTRHTQRVLYHNRSIM